jgi:hypothetical protein
MSSPVIGKWPIVAAQPCTLAQIRLFLVAKRPGSALTRRDGWRGAKAREGLTATEWNTRMVAARQMTGLLL